jgi:NAD(P)-dependent dehydrogenase (short-subunit alcohol dehydrogenase family)
VISNLDRRTPTLAGRIRHTSGDSIRGKLRLVHPNRVGKRFERKVAVVTGGASGIGDAIVRRLLSEGASVVAFDIDADLLAERRLEFGASFHAVCGDVTHEADVAQLIEECAQRFGGLDVAFNVAGAGKSSPIVNHDVNHWEFTVDLCLKGVLLCMKYEAPQMIERGGGAIVNVSSVCAHFPVYGAAAYCAAKSGVEMLSKVAAIELAEEHIRINTLLPGYTYTPGMRMASDSPHEDRAIVQRIPLGRAASATDIADPALFLASDEARYIVGTSLVVDGGWELSTYPKPRAAV